MKLTEIYIFREYLVANWGLIRIDSECLFDSLENACAHLKKEVREKVEINFRFSISKFILNDPEARQSSEEWVYLTDGSLLRHIYPDCVPEPSLYEGRFSVGDIVRIKSEIENPSFGLTFENVGVIYQLPEAEDDSYIVIFISEKGCASHLHLPEEALSHESVVVTDENSFLKVLASSLKDGSAEELNEQVWGDVYVRKIGHYYYD